jgi:hypothetical protein
MSYAFDSRLGERLYLLLPEIYRTRDRQVENGEGSGSDQHLARYLDSHGQLLDLIHATLEQQLKDALPATSQEWLLPYFARLLATNILSPDPAGKHAEVANAVAWRQRKGTLKCAEEIAEAVGQMEVEIQEGWKRVAMTPWIGMALVPATALDNTLELEMALPFEAARHPGLPATLIDLRRPSRAVEALAGNPAAKSSNFGGIRQTWRQLNRQGVPCFPDSFEDVSRRTLDLRTPNAQSGRFQHKALLVFAPPPTGFFGLDPIQLTWGERGDALHEHLIEEVVESGVTVIRNRSGRALVISDPVILDARPFRIEGLNFRQELSQAAGGRLELSRVEADKVSVPTFATDEPVLVAGDCLFRELSGGGLVKLERCTVVETAFLTLVEIRDSILMAIAGTAIRGSIEYSRIPAGAPLSGDQAKMVIKSHNSDDSTPVTADPGFIQAQTNLSARAVLSPNAPSSVYAGARDRGEMGYYQKGRPRPVHLTGSLDFMLPAEGGYPLTEVIFDAELRVTAGQLVLSRSVAPTLRVLTPLNAGGPVIPSLVATDCLFQHLSVPQGLARLEYCTVMETTECKHLQASDCIFAGTISGTKKQAADSGTDAFLNCLRFSALPPGILDLEPALLRALQLVDKDGRSTLRNNTLIPPLFGEFRFCSSPESPRPAAYGDWGYGVLAPLTRPEVAFGAEDGGEMGAYHHRFYSLKAAAMLNKMREFLPVGIEAVLIQDERLLHVPPEI